MLTKCFVVVSAKDLGPEFPSPTHTLLIQNEVPKLFLKPNVDVKFASLRAWIDRFGNVSLEQLQMRNAQLRKLDAEPVHNPPRKVARKIRNVSPLKRHLVLRPSSESARMGPMSSAQGRCCEHP